MRSITLKSVLSIGAGLFLGSLNLATAGIIDCNSETTLAALQTMSNNGDVCMIGGVGGGTDKGLFAPLASDIAANFSLSGGVYSLEFDFSPANGTGSPAAVAYQTLGVDISYLVGVTDPSQTISVQGGQVTAGLLSLDGSEDASALGSVFGCQGGGMSGFDPTNCASGLVSPLHNASWTSSVGSDTDIAATDPDNQGPKSETASPLDSTSFGVLDEATLDGGDIDTGTTNAALFSITNTLTESTVETTTPEPATLLLLGGSLAGIGLLRRRKKSV